MGVSSVIPLLLAFLGSFLIAAFASSKNRTPRVEDHLYSGNKPTLAIASELGSLFSLSVCCTALLSGGYIFGWQVVIPIASGVLVAVGILRSGLRTAKLRRFLHSNRKEGMKRGASIFVFLGEIRGASVTIVYCSCALIFYALLLTAELLLTRLLLDRLAGASGAILVLMLCLLAATCFMYVFIGGFRGVLYTDHFQFILILLFLGSLFGMADIEHFVGSIPSPTKSLLPSGLGMSVLLHGSAFIGTVMILLGTPDHWTRLLGTLDPGEVSQTATWALLLFGLGSALPVIIGSTLHAHTLVPAGVTNEASLYLLDEFFTQASPGILFLAYMVLACVLLTTLDTYIITTQQLYYEIAIRLHAESSLGYLAEWVLKWKEVRAISLLPLAAAVLFTILFPGTNVYILGVYALAGASFWVPAFVIELLSDQLSCLDGLVSSRTQILSLLCGIAFSPWAIEFFARFWGPLEDHLFLILAGAASSSVGSHLLILGLKALWQARRIKFRKT